MTLIRDGYSTDVRGGTVKNMRRMCDEGEILNRLLDDIYSRRYRHTRESTQAQRI